MLVTVHTDRGNISIEITFTDRISDVKDKISDKLGCSVAQQRLFFMGDPLEDHKYVSDYDFHPESVLQLEIQVKLLVKMCSQKIEVDCYPSWSIIEVKHEISRKSKIPENNQVLYFDEKPLDNNKTVMECKLQNNSCIDMTGIIMVKVNFPSGKVVSYPTNQNSSVYEMKQKIWEKNRIPIDRQTLNYKGRELREEQTFSSIRYKSEDNVSLVCKQLPGDQIQVFVRKPGGEKRFVSLKKYDPVGKVEDTAGFELEDLFSHDCYYNDILLDDTSVLDVYNIQKHSELELKCARNVVPVFFTSPTTTDVTFHLKPTDVVSDVIARVRPKLQGYNEHRRLFYRHTILNNDQVIGSIHITPGDHFFLGTDDSLTITVNPPGSDFTILVSKRESVRDLMYQIERKERIPKTVQSLTKDGSPLYMDQRISQTDLRCGSIVRLDILPDGVNNRRINIRVWDLLNNSQLLSNVDPYSTVRRLREHISYSAQDALVHNDVVLVDTKLICSYGIRNESEILLVSVNRNLLNQPPVNTDRSQYHEREEHRPRSGPQHFDTHAPEHDRQWHPTETPRYPNDYYAHEHSQPPPQPYEHSQPHYHHQPPPQPYEHPQPQPHYHLQQHTQPPPPYFPQPQQQQQQPPHFQHPEGPIASIHSVDGDYDRSSNLQREVNIHILDHPSGIKSQVKCCINDSVASLSNKISEDTKIPSSKIHLIYEGTRLSNQKKKLMDYRISEDTMVHLDDVFYLNVVYGATHRIIWVNGSDFVGRLAEEFAAEIGVWKGSIKLSYKGGHLESHNSFNDYQIKNTFDIFVEDIQ